MPTNKTSREKALTNPTQLPESERAYYRATWGFDPVGDCIPLIRGERRYEACFPHTFFGCGRSPRERRTKDAAIKILDF